MLPMAQTVWYMPTGLDPWNQLIGKAPGHYTRLYDIKVNQTPPMPAGALARPGARSTSTARCRERLNHWLTLVQRGEVLASYRVFLGLMEDAPNRRAALAHLAFAGLIDVQDRMLHNRSYTTGHKSYRARATIELGEALGWDNAHHVLYAGVPDIAVGPRWYSTYEMGCNVVQNLLDGRDRELLAQDGAADPGRGGDAGRRHHAASASSSVIDAIVALLKAGRGAAPDPRRHPGRRGPGHPRHRRAEQLLDGAARLRVLQHGRLVLRHVRASAPAEAAVRGRARSSTTAPSIRPTRRATGAGPSRSPPGADALPPAELLERLDDALLALRADEAVDLTAAYLKAGFDRAPLVQRSPTAACTLGNDPHNQELGLCLLEDYRTQPGRRSRAPAAGLRQAHGRPSQVRRPLECYRRFAEAFDLAER